MAIPSDQVNNLHRQSGAGLPPIEPRRVQQAGPDAVIVPPDGPHFGAANADQIEAPRQEVQNAPPRTYVSVANLHQGHALASKFHRVNPSNKQISEELGERFAQHFDVKPAAMDRMAIPQATLKEAYRHDFEVTRLNYQDLHQELKAVQRERDAGKSMFERVKDWFNNRREGRTAKLDFEARFIDEGEDSNSLHLKMGVADGQAAAGKIDIKLRDLEKPIDTAGIRDDKSVAVKKAIYGVGTAALFVVGGVAATVATSAAVATAPIWIPIAVGVAAGAAIIGGIAMGAIAMFGKHPWWGGTLQGKIEHAERAQARTLADTIEEQVLEKALTDSRPRNVDAQGVRFEKRDIIYDEAALQDFILLARKKSPGDLVREIRKSLLNPEKSPLSADTIAYASGAKKPKWHGFLQGRPGAHANKTVDTYAEEIAQGIMRGVTRAVVQSRIGELSDEMSAAADAEVSRIETPVLNEFTQALEFLNPAQNPRTFAIADTLAHTRKLQALLGAGLVGQQAGTIDRAIELFNDAKDIIGTENANAYSEAMQTFKADVDKHIASLADVEKLIVRPPGPEQEAPRQEDELAPPGPPVLQNISDGVQAALDGLDTLESVNEAEARLTALADGLRQRVQSTDDPDSRRLVESHAQQFLQLVDQFQKVGQASIRFARAETGANISFRAEALSLDTVRDQKAKLEDTWASAFRDLNIDPSQRFTNTLTGAQAAAGQRLNTQIERCGNLLEAAEYSKKAGNLVSSTLALAREGNLVQALKADNQTNIDAWNQGYDRGLKRWIGDAPNLYTHPQGLGITSPAEWKRQLVAAHLGLGEDKVARLQPVLDRLVHSAKPGEEDQGALKVLRELGQRNPAQLVSILESLNEEMPRAGDPTDVTLALRHLARLRGAPDLSGDMAQQVAAALHPAHLPLLLKAQSLQELLGQLDSANDQIGDQLRDLTRADGAPAGSDDRTTPALLTALASFLESNPSAEALAQLRSDDNLAALKAVAASLRDTQNEAAQNNQGMDTRLGQADAIERFNTDQLRQVMVIVGQLTDRQSPSFQRMTALHQQREQRLAEAAKLASVILPGAVNSSSQALQQKVLQDAAPSNAALREELKGVVQQLLAQYNSAQIVNNDLHLQEEKIQEAAQHLVSALNFKGSKDELIKKIQADPYMGLLLWRYMDASAKLNAAVNQPLPGLGHEFKESELATGAAQFAAAYVAENDRGIARLLDPKAGPIVETRNRYLQRLKNKSGPLTEKQITNRLKNSDTRSYVEGHLYENRVYEFLKDKSKTDSAKNIRAAIEGSYDPQEATALQLGQLKVQALAQSGAVEQHILRGLEKRIKVLSALLQEQTDIFGAAGPWRGHAEAELSRLEAQLNDLQQGIKPLLESPEAGVVKALGRLMFEADEAIGATEEQLKLAFIKGQQVETARALRHFDIRKLTEATGWSNVFFRLFKRGEANLRRVVATGNPQEISRDISLIAAGSMQSASLKAEQRQIQLQINALQTRKRELVADQQSVNNAYALLMLERLAESENAGESGAISDADHADVASRLKEMVGDNAELHLELAAGAKTQTSLDSLLKYLNVNGETIAAMREARLEIQSRQAVLQKEALDLKNKITEAAVAKAQADELKLIESSGRLGLQAADYLVLKGLMPDRVSSLVKEWGAVFDHIEAGRYPDAWAKATDLRLEMESLLATDGRRPNEKTSALLPILVKIEAEMESSMPAFAPLESYLKPDSLAARAIELVDSIERTYRTQAARLLNWRPGKAPPLSDDEIKAFQTEVENQSGRFQTLLATIQEQEGDSKGRLRQDRQYSKTTLQQIGIRGQSMLANSLWALHLAGRSGLSDQTDCRSLARYHAYNAGLINSQLETATDSRAPGSGGYRQKDLANYKEAELKALERRIQRAFEKDEPREFTVAGRNALRDADSDLLNQAQADLGDDVFSREDLVRNPALTSAMAMPGSEPGAGAKKGLGARLKGFFTGSDK